MEFYRIIEHPFSFKLGLMLEDSKYAIERNNKIQEKHFIGLRIELGIITIQLGIIKNL